VDVPLAPPVVGVVTYKLCKEMSARDGVPTASRVTVREIPRRLRHGEEREEAERESPALRS
jgi:hypothetical protein